MRKKINLVFDVSILHAGLDKQAGRSGIYFTGFNILRQFIQSKDLKISFYCRQDWIKKLKKGLKNELSEFKNYKIINKNLKKYTEKSDYYKLRKKEAKKAKKKLKKAFFHVMYAYWKFRLRCHQYKLSKIDVFFSPVWAIPEEIKNIENIKKYTLLHDCIPVLFKEYYPQMQTGNYWFINFLNSLNSKDYYFSISQCTKNDFLKICPQIQESQILVTPLAAAETFYPQPELTSDVFNRYGLQGIDKYVFSLCTLEPRKNLVRAVKTFIQFIKKNNIENMSFILGGGHWSSFLEVLKQEIEDLDLYRNKIIRAGYIDDEDLAPLYSGAEWFVYTSQYEGFGLPPLEAMACGCPVITSNSSSLPEVVGDAGIMIDWDSDEQHIQAYEKYYFDKEFRNSMAEKGIERASQFSWTKCADIMINKMKRDCENDR